LAALKPKAESVDYVEEHIFSRVGPISSRVVSRVKGL
jgi:hypothetical protein